MIAETKTKNGVNSDVWQIASSAYNVGSIEDNPVLLELFSSLDADSTEPAVATLLKKVAKKCKDWQAERRFISIHKLIEVLSSMKLVVELNDDMFESLLSDSPILAILVKIPMIEKIYSFHKNGEKEFWVCVKEQRRKDRLQVISEVNSYCRNGDAKYVECVFIETAQLDVEEMPEPLYSLEKKG